MIAVKRLKDEAFIPTRSYHSAGYDLYASTDRECPPGEVTTVRTGIAIELPPGHVGLVWDRSGMGKKGLTVFGGVVDEDYRGEWLVMLFNSTTQPYHVYQGDRIAQFLIQKVVQDELVESYSLSETERGAAGFSSTGR
jgi:dUTP pyrophosphatase